LEEQLCQSKIKKSNQNGLNKATTHSIGSCFVEPQSFFAVCCSFLLFKEIIVCWQLIEVKWHYVIVVIFNVQG